MTRTSRGHLRWAGTAIGVARNGETIAAVRGERRGSRVAYEPLDVGKAAEMVSRGALCAGHMPARQTIARWFEAPFDSKWKARRVMPTLLDIHLPFALEDSCHAIMAGGRAVSGRARYLAVAARIEDVRRRIEELNAAGFDPVVLDHEGLALWSQSISEREPSARDAVRIVVNAAGDASTLAFGTAHEFLAVYPWRTRDLESAARLVKACRAALATQDAVAEWAWTGPEAADAAFVARAREILGAHWSGGHFTHEEPAFFLARAIAGRALSDGPFRCNLRIGALEHRVISEHERRVTAWSAVVLCASSLFLFGSSLGVRLMLSGVEQGLDGEFSAVAARTAGFPVAARGQHALKIVEAAIESRRKDLLPFINRAGPSLTDILGEITVAAASNSLQIASLNLERTKICINGMAGDWAGCQRMVSFLKDLGYDPRLDIKDSGTDGRVPFSIEAGGLEGAPR